VVILIEASEVSGSPDLPVYMQSLASRVGTPRLVIALDSTCGNYDQLWVTTSLRGMLIGRNPTRASTHLKLVLPQRLPCRKLHKPISAHLQCIWVTVAHCVHGVLCTSSSRRPVRRHWCAGSTF
jgi:hypothetical protein